jgi:hypothetical protein
MQLLIVLQSCHIHNILNKEINAGSRPKVFKRIDIREKDSNGLCDMPSLSKNQDHKENPPTPRYEFMN